MQKMWSAKVPLRNYVQRITLLLLALSTVNDARRWDYSFTQATPDQAITFSDGNEIRGTISSPNYPDSFTTMGSSVIRIISAPKLALLQMDITDREVDDLPVLYISRSSELNETLITTSRLFLVMPDCKVIIRLPPSENQKPFKIFYSVSLLHELKTSQDSMTEQDHSHGYTNGHYHGDHGASSPLDISKYRFGYIISDKSYEMEDEANFQTPQNTSSTQKLKLVNTNSTDVALLIQIISMRLVPCDSDHLHDEEYQCHHTDDYSHHEENVTAAALNFQTLNYHSVIANQDYRRCFECGTGQKLNSDWLSFTLKIDRAIDDGVPSLTYQIQNGPADHGFLLKYTVVGCPWEGRNFAAVNRITYGNDMSIQCQEGFYGKGSSSFTAKCYQDGTWEDDARCIWISENYRTNPAEGGQIDKKSDRSVVVFELAISLITIFLFIVIVTLAVIVFKQRQKKAATSGGMKSAKECRQMDREISDVMIEVDDLTSDTAYVNVAMENGLQRASVEIHRTHEDDKKINYNKKSPDRERKSITVSFKRHRSDDDKY